METIYILMDPRNGSIRYVGRTSIKLSYRLNIHRNKAERNLRPKSKLYNWIREVLSEGLQPLIIPIAQASAGLEASILEKYYIHSVKLAGHPITNKHHCKS